MQYMESKDFPLTEQQIKDYMAQRTFPHTNSFNDMVFFDTEHIDWWIAEQRKSRVTT